MTFKLLEQVEFIKLGQELACHALPNDITEGVKQQSVDKIDRLYYQLVDNGHRVPDIAESMRPKKVHPDGVIDLSKKGQQHDLKHLLIMDPKWKTKMEVGQLVQFYNLITGFVEEMEMGDKSDWNYDQKKKRRNHKYNSKLFVEVYEPPILHWQRINKLSAMARGESV